MTGIFLYEIKRRLKSILVFCLCIIAVSVSTWFIMRWCPQFVVAIARLINRFAMLRSFLGINKAIEAITYKQAAMSVLTVAYPVFCYLLIRTTANSFWCEEQYGTLHYFYAQPVSRTDYWTAKTLANVLSYALYTTLLYLSVIMLSLTNVTVKILKEITMEDVNNVMISIICISMLCVGIGTLLGSLTSWQKAQKPAFDCFCIMIVLCLLPCVFRVLAAWMEKADMSLESVNTIIKFTEKIRLIIPLYWCNPSLRMNNALTVWQICAISATAIIAFAAAVAIYHKRSLICA